MIRREEYQKLIASQLNNADDSEEAALEAKQKVTSYKVAKLQSHKAGLRADAHRCRCPVWLKSHSPSTS